MTQSFADGRIKRFFETGKTSGFGGLDVEAAEELLAVLDAATSLQDMAPLKSAGLHELLGDRKSQWAMTLSGPRRLCFRFNDGDAFDVQIADYHRG